MNAPLPALVTCDPSGAGDAADPLVLDLLQRRVPRYTSYPTALEFGPAVGPEAYREWLGALPAREPLSLYLHVPFCRSLCWYCGCHTMVASHDDPIADYADALVAEIGTVSGLAAPARGAVRHIHFGGGTPTILAEADFRRIVDTLRDRFEVAPDAELAVEIDPRTLTHGMIRTLAAAGVNRASLGVQDFDPSVQAAIHRIQGFEQTRSVVEGLRDAGIASINLDLMYGLPRQTVAGIGRTIELSLSLAPDRISLFGYAHLPEKLRHQRRIDEGTLPVPAERLRQMQAASALLLERGYRAVGLDHFARAGDPLAGRLAAGTLHRNFQGYTTDGAPALIGFGASAIGRMAEGYAQNQPAIARWMETVRAGGLATVRGVALTRDDRMRGMIIERLMCDLKVDLAPIAGAFDTHWRSLRWEMAALAPIVAAGFATVEGPVVRVTDAGRPFVRLVASVFDAYAERTKASTLAV